MGDKHTDGLPDPSVDWAGFLDGLDQFLKQKDEAPEQWVGSCEFEFVCVCVCECYGPLTDRRTTLLTFCFPPPESNGKKGSTLA